jgi:regulator of sigma E protease
MAKTYGRREKRYMIGVQLGLFAMNETKVVRRGPIAAVIQASKTSWDLSTSIFRYLSRMIQGQIKPKALSGPIGIIPIIGLSWLESFHTLMMMLALISINLGVMNLLPLAITDGGILFFLGIEAVRGKALSRSFQARIQQVATAFFITLFLYLTVQDLSRFSMFLR